ncbi:MAG: glycosyltransferase [Patescibacteria group bacterium]
MKVSFIATVFNEERTINDFLKSIFQQSTLPDEMIIVDGGSSDWTIANIKNQISKIKKKENRQTKFKVLVKKGNRSVGRNEAIKNTTGDIIVCSDAGNILDEDWVKNIIEPFNDSKTDVVAGYYKGNVKNIFQKCLIPYVLVMPDKVNQHNFLPSTRSMAFRKSIWKKVSGFPEGYSHNEDYVFAKRLKKANAKIIFRKDAIVDWIPRRNTWEAFIMFFRFALGDVESGIFRNKAFFIFARYILGLYLLLLSFIEKSLVPLYLIILTIFFYIPWSIKKNYKYVRDVKAIFFLPLLQFVSDLAVIMGTTFGLLKKIKHSSFYQIIKNNKGVSIIIGLYILLMITVIDWGIPNTNHPFNYFMDEWHQAQAVRGVFRVGSPNIPGAANGSMFHFLLSGLFFIPFIAFGIVNPFIIGSPVENLEMQQKIFQVLRLNTLFFGVASIVLISYIAKKYFRLHPFFTTFLFVVNPIWLSFSNYFKYDIALIFWILLSIVPLFSYIKKPKASTFYITAFLCGISLAVKISAIPLVMILFVAFFLNQEKKHFAQLFIGVIIYVGTFLIFGITDLLLGKGNISEYLYDNIIRTPSLVDNYILGMHYIAYLITRVVPTAFGHVLFFVSGLGAIYLLFNLIKNKMSKNNIDRIILFLFISFFIFSISLIPLKIEARGNRLLVLLPFMTVFSGIFINNIFSYTKSYFKKIFIFGLTVVLFLQIFESISWIYVKLGTDPRQKSSDWIVRYIKPKSVIGIENIPIYQFLPDIILKEFYAKKYDNSKKTIFSYQVIDSSPQKYPSYIVVSNEEIAESYLKDSPKKNLISKIKNENYKKVFYTREDFALLKIFRTELDYFMSGLIQSPVSISIYKSPTISE